MSFLPERIQGWRTRVLRIKTGAENTEGTEGGGNQPSFGSRFTAAGEKKASFILHPPERGRETSTLCISTPHKRLLET